VIVLSDNNNESFINSFAGAGIGAWLSIFFSKADEVNNIYYALIFASALIIQLFILFWRWGYLLTFLKEIKSNRKSIFINETESINIIKNSIFIFFFNSFIFLGYALVLNFTKILFFGIALLFVWIGATIFTNLRGVEIKFKFGGF